MNPPRIYGQWAGNEQGNREGVTRCITEVWTGWHSHQCERNRGHGPDGLYCKQHAKREAERQFDAQRDERNEP